MKKLTTLFLCALVCLGLISCTTVLEAGSTYHFSISGVSDTHEKAFTLQAGVDTVTLEGAVALQSGSAKIALLTEDGTTLYQRSFDPGQEETFSLYLERLPSSRTYRLAISGYHAKGLEITVKASAALLPKVA